MRFDEGPGWVVYVLEARKRIVKGGRQKDGDPNCYKMRGEVMTQEQRL